MTFKAFVPLAFVTAILMCCCLGATFRGDDPPATTPTAEQAQAPGQGQGQEQAQEPGQEQGQGQEPAATAATPWAGDTGLATMSPAEIRTLVDTTIRENDGLKKIVRDMSGNMDPVISIDKEPDAIYPYYDVYIGAQSGDHGWRLFTFIIDPRTKTIKVECTDVKGFDNGSVDEFVSAYNACEDINPAK